MISGKILIPITLSIFVVLFVFGIHFAGVNPLVNDEIHTQVQTIHGCSYLQVIMGKARGEGNNTPLYYMIQKIICDSAHFKTPQSWIQGMRISSDRHDMILLRLNSIFFTALAGGALFYYFARFYSYSAGVFSLIVFFSSSYIWLHWAQARPYSLWNFLTTLQSLLFLNILSKKENYAKILWILAVVHILLSLTVILSLGQIAAVSLLLWLFKEKRIKYYLALSIVPALLCFYYYSGVKVFHGWIMTNFMTLIYSCVPQEQAVFILFYLLLTLLFFWHVGGHVPISRFIFHKKEIGTCPPIYPNEEVNRRWREAGVYLLLVVLLFIAAFVLFSAFQMKGQAPPGGVNRVVVARYFLFLTPVGVIATVLFSINLWRTFQNNKWLQLNLGIFMTGLMILTYLKNHTLWIYVNFLWKYFKA